MCLFFLNTKISNQSRLQSLKITAAIVTIFKALIILLSHGRSEACCRRRLSSSILPETAVLMMRLNCDLHLTFHPFRHFCVAIYFWPFFILSVWLVLLLSSTSQALLQTPVCSIYFWRPFVYFFNSAIYFIYLSRCSLVPFGSFF